MIKTIDDLKIWFRNYTNENNHMGYKEKLEKSKSGEMKLVRRRFTDVEKYEENIMKLIEVSN